MRRLVETYETLGGDVWRRMRRLVKRIRIHMCDWKKQVPWGLVFSRSGNQKWKNKSPGNLFFPFLFPLHVHVWKFKRRLS